MPGKSPRSCHATGRPHPDAHPIQAWETQHPGLWLLLEITEEDEGEPVRGRLLATAEDPDALQAAWKSYRDQGVLTMLTYGPPQEPRPEVVVSAT
jgi:hypothetical protein